MYDDVIAVLIVTILNKNGGILDCKINELLPLLTIQANSPIEDLNITK